MSRYTCLTIVSVFFIVMDLKMALVHPIKLVSITSTTSLLAIIKSRKPRSLDALFTM